MGFWDFFKSHGTVLRAPVPRIFDQATFVPGSLWVRVSHDGSCVVEPWPTPSRNDATFQGCLETAMWR